MVEGAPAGLEVEVVRSTKRRRTVSAVREGDRVIVRIPARMSKAEEARWVALLLDRLARTERRRRPGDAQLSARARELSARYLGGRAAPASVRWVTNQNGRWGSCTPSDRTIRLSRRLEGMPGWVVDYVLLHELAHLIEPGHGERFWALLAGYPRLERARGYLEGVAAAAGLDLQDDAGDDAAEGTEDAGETGETGAAEDVGETGETGDAEDAGETGVPGAAEDTGDAAGPWRRRSAG